MAWVRIACKMVQVTATHRFTFSILRFLSLGRALGPNFLFFRRSVRRERGRVVMRLRLWFHACLSLSINSYSFTFWFTFVEFERPQQGISLPLSLTKCLVCTQPDTFAFRSVSRSRIPFWSSRAITSSHLFENERSASERERERNRANARETSFNTSAAYFCQHSCILETPWTCAMCT